MFERLRAAMNAALDAASSADARTLTARMREAVIDARASIEAMREGVVRTDRLLANERRQLEDAERRGRLAAGIADQDTAEVAERFAATHREWVDVLDRKLTAQRDELALAEREYADMRAQLKHAERDRQVGDTARSVEAAWRNLEAAGIGRPETDVEGAHLAAELDRAEREARAEAQLDELKRRMRGS